MLGGISDTPADCTYYGEKMDQRIVQAVSRFFHQHTSRLLFKCWTYAAAPATSAVGISGARHIAVLWRFPSTH